MKVGDVLVEFKLKPPSGAEAPVLTLTERNGFVLQSERFNKRLATDDTSGYKYINRDDFAFNPYLLWAGAIARNDRFEEGVISPLYPTFRAREGYSPSFLSRIMLSSSMIKGYDSIAFGSVPRRRRSSVKDFLDLEIPELPSFEDQQRIADILDKADALRAKRREAIAHLDSLGQSIFHEMFANESGVRLDEIAEFRYGTSNKSQPIGVPCLRIPNIVSGETDFSNMKNVPVSQDELERLRLKDGDLLFVRSNGNPDAVGRSSVFESDERRDYIYASYLIRARLTTDLINSQYLQAYLSSSKGLRALRERARTSAGQFNINTKSLGSLLIPVPGRSAQDEFVLRIRKVSQLRSQYRAELGELDNLFLSLQDRAFKGEL